MIGSHSTGNASHGPPRYSPTHHLAGRRHAHRPAFRLRGPPRAGAARRAHLHHADHPFQEPLAGTLKFPCHFLTATRAHPHAPMPATAQLHLSHAHAQAACTHSHAGRTHHLNPLRAQLLRFLACMRLLTCNVPPQGVTPAPAVTPSSEETASDVKVTPPIIGPIILPTSP